MNIFIYFGLTILIELPVVIVFYKDQWLKTGFISLLINAFTWPLLQLTLLEVDRSWIPMLEIIIVCIEGVGYYLLLNGKLSKAFLISLLANGLSYGIGLLTD